MTTQSEQRSGTPDYTVGFSEEFLRSLRRYTAESNAAHLLPHLKPGLRVLDFGCGPGMISVGLAKAVAPGELHGVDMEQSQVDIARNVAAVGGHTNAEFHVGDVTALDFEDDYFDVAHCHNVLMHVPDTARTLAEAKRILKPGGIIACREMITSSCFTEPDFGVIRKAWDMFGDLVAADDGHPQMGRELKGHLSDAGFADIRASASFDMHATPDDIDYIHAIALRWFLSPEIVEAAIKYGASTQKLCDDIRVAYDRWKDHPGALVGVAYGEVLANKPSS